MTATRDELIEAMRSLADALAFARGPRGEVIYLGDAQRVALAWHLARAGVPPIDPQRAVVKRSVIPDRPGSLAGVVDWIPADADDPNPQRTAENSAAGEPDIEEMWSAIPWHVKTKIEGDFR